MVDRVLLISFEGIDASGKNTQSKLLHEWLKSNGVQSEYLSFPDYETAIGQEILAFLSGKKHYGLEARHMLYSANRYEHKDQIEEWLKTQKEGSVVIINRYCDSNIAYGVASGLPLQWLKELESRMPQADYVFFLRATPQLSIKRKSKRDKFEVDFEFLNRVSEVYGALAESPNWFSLDADGSIESIHYEITRLANDLLKEEAEKDFPNKNPRPEHLVPK